MGLEGGGTDYKQAQRNLDMFTILVVVMVSWVYTYVKIHQTMFAHLSYFIYNSMKLCVRGKNPIGDIK